MNKPVDLDVPQNRLHVPEILLKLVGEVEDVVEDFYLQVAFDDRAADAELFQLRQRT